MFLLAPKLAYSGRFWDGLGQGNCTVVVIQNMDDFPESGEISLLHFAFSQLVEFFFGKKNRCVRCSCCFARYDHFYRSARNSATGSGAPDERGWVGWLLLAPSCTNAMPWPCGPCFRLLHIPREASQLYSSSWIATSLAGKVKWS